jgi:hypothetical protein
VLGFVLSLLILRLISIILGGCGMFCLVMSFVVPALGAHAFVLLSSATAIVVLTAPRR